MSKRLKDAADATSVTDGQIELWIERVSKKVPSGDSTVFKSCLNEEARVCRRE